MRHFALRPAQTKQLHACAALFNATSREAFLADAAYLLRKSTIPAIPMLALCCIGYSAWCRLISSIQSI